MEENNSQISGDGGGPPPKSSTNPNSDSDFINTNTGSGAGTDESDDLAAAASASAATATVALARSRTPFTNLSQKDADLALARTLQEQERAYMMLSMNGGMAGYGRGNTGIYLYDDEDDDYDEVDDDDEEDDDGDDDEAEDDHDGYYDEEEDAFDLHARADSGENNVNGVELNPSDFPDDEAYARALQDAEEREMAARLLAITGLTEREIVDVEEQDDNSQDSWEDVDPDELSYEELLALGEVVGTESRGLSAESIASLATTNYKVPITQATDCDSCVICRLDYENGDALTTLPCRHAYHSECVTNWLKINKVCPVCSTEVSTSGCS